MKRLASLSWFMIFGVVLMAAITLCSCNTKSIPDGHKCNLSQCPYKGVTADLAHTSVVMYLGETGTNAYYLDILHLQYPTEEYEQLEERLFNNTKSK